MSALRGGRCLPRGGVVLCVMLLGCLAPLRVRGQDEAVQQCMRSVFSFPNLGSNPSDTAIEKLNNTMTGFCAEFKSPEGNHIGMGEHCIQITHPDAPVPLLAVQVYGCCDGEIATEMQAKYKVSSCTNIGEGVSMPSISIEVIPGNLIFGNLLDASNTTHTNSDAATMKEGLEDWRFWGILLICTVLMLLLCTCCLCCMCKRYKKKERDEKYQVERQRRLLAQSGSLALKSGEENPAGTTRDLEDQSPLVKSGRNTEMVERDADLEYSDSEYDYSAPPTPAGRVAGPGYAVNDGSGRSSRLQGSSRP